MMPESDHRTTQNQVSDYGWSQAQGPHSCDYLTPVVIEILAQLGVNSVLDVGAGNGQLCRHLKDSGYAVAGMEYDLQGVKIARRQNPVITFYHLGVQDSPEQLMQTHGAFDTVVSTEVVEHLYSPHLLPEFAYKVLKNRGYLIISTPYHGYLKNLLLSILNKWDTHHSPLWHGGHIKFWSRKSLSLLLQQSGFDVIKFKGVGRVPYLWKSMVIIARKR